MTRRRIYSALLASCMLGLIASSPTAWADDSAQADWESISAVSPDLRTAIGTTDDRAARDATIRSDGSIVRLGKAAVSLPTSQRGPLKVKSRKASGALLSSLGANASVATVERDGGKSVQLLVMIESSAAATEYGFGVSEGRVTNDSDGLISISAGDETWLLAPPWAKDARGRDVPTRFEVRKNQIVQVVEHNESYEYPIIADPFLGRAIFTNITRDIYNGDYRYNGSLTSWGLTIYAAAGAGGVIGGVSGQAILRTYGWNEWKAKYSAVTNKATIKQQFDCHALGALLAGRWNIERFRSNNSNWFVGVAIHRCNW